MSTAVPESAVPEAGVWAVVVAAGAGTRFGAHVPKQYLPLGQARVLDHTLATTRAICGARIVLVVPADRAADAEHGVRVVSGGATRSASVRSGLAAVPHDAEIVLVHDAARPLAPAAVFERVIAGVRAGADAAVPGVGVVDTIKRVSAGVVVETLPRAELVAVQTPQAFRADVLRRVHATSPDGSSPEASDDAVLVEQDGGRVVVVEGDELGRKLTTADDLAWLAAKVAARKTAHVGTR